MARLPSKFRDSAEQSHTSATYIKMHGALQLMLGASFMACTHAVAVDILETRDEDIYDMVKRPLDCGGVLYDGPMARCPMYGTVTRTNTVTATTTATATASRILESPATCGNQGWEYAVFTHVPDALFPPQGQTNGWRSSNTRKNGTYTMIYAGVTQGSVGGFYCVERGNTTVYGRGFPFPCWQYTIMHRGYLYSPPCSTAYPCNGQGTRDYTINVSRVDDAVNLWESRPSAFSWLEYAPSITTYISNGVAGSGVLNRALQPDSYFPIRVAFGNGISVSQFDMSIKIDLNGQEQLGTSNMVQHDCNYYDPAGPVAGDANSAYAGPFSAIAFGQEQF